MNRRPSSAAISTAEHRSGMGRRRPDLRGFIAGGWAIAVVVMLGGAAPTAAQSPAAEPQPSCRSGESGPVGGPSHSGDGVVDPAGRIAYAVVGRFDDAFGPIGTQLYAVDPDGSDRVLLLDCDVIRPQWSPDGSRLAFTVGLDDGSWHVATIAADGSELRLLTSGPGIHEIPSWSPDGDWLAYDSADVGLDDPAFRTTLWRVGADGSGAALLGDAETFDVEPRLSPDGSRVAFMRVHPEADWASEIVVRDLASGEERVVVPREVPAEHPEWSPDGGSLVFNGSDFAPNAATIYRFDLDEPDAEPVVLLDKATGEWGGVKPVYSPDGSHIVFVCVEADEPEDGICIMDADGTNVTPLVDDPGVSENHVAWGVAAP
jgi:Tol biopolymer transport system component